MPPSKEKRIFTNETQSVKENPKGQLCWPGYKSRVRLATFFPRPAEDLYFHWVFTLGTRLAGSGRQEECYMKASLKALYSAGIKHHFLPSLAIVLLVSWVISEQITHRTTFANSELYQDVVERWGAPILQSAPSVRYVQSATVFNSLAAMPLSSQQVDVRAKMNYRKRGLVYFSGFDFRFIGRYEVQNPHPYDIDTVFVFPLQECKNQVLLSDLKFEINGKAAALEMAEDGNRLVWTGRLKPAERFAYTISYSGRGLNSFHYLLDPSLRVHDFQLAVRISGGDNFDYPDGVVPANQISAEDDSVKLVWNYASLESGVPVGLILPSERSYAAIVATMVQRSWAPFLFFFTGILALALFHHRPLRFYEAYLIAAGYGLFFVLTAYLAAFVHFYAAYVISMIFVLAMLTGYLRAILSPAVGPIALGLGISFLLVPTLAVVLSGYTGLIYTLEIASGIAGLMYITAQLRFRSLIDRISSHLLTTGQKHAP